MAKVFNHYNPAACKLFAEAESEDTKSYELFINLEGVENPKTIALQLRGTYILLNSYGVLIFFF